MKYKEDDLLMAVVRYLKLQYPYVLFTHIANERKASPIAGARLKAKGVMAGMPDLLIFRRSYCFIGLAIELKIAPNKLKPNQIIVLNQLESEGWQCNVCFDLDSAIEIIDNYLK